MGNPAKLLWLLWFLLVVSVLGVAGYMCERWKRAQPYRYDWMLSAFALHFVLPFRYLKDGLKEKDGKAPVVFGVFWVLLAAAIWVGCLAAGKEKQPPNPAPEAMAPAASAEGGTP